MWQTTGSRYIWAWAKVIVTLVSDGFEWVVGLGKAKFFEESRFKNTFRFTLNIILTKIRGFVDWAC